MMDFGGKSVLITGVAGFVGANLTEELLARGAEVHGLVRTTTNLWRLNEWLPKLRLHRIDLSNAFDLEEVLQTTRPDVIYHLATQRGSRTPPERSEMARSNLLGTLNLLESARTVGCERFIHAGGSLEYGPKASPTHETECPVPTSFYGATKAASTLLCQQFSREHHLPLVILRLYSVYGYWEGPERLIPKAMMAALGNGSLALTAESFRRDFVFAPDVVEACLLAADADTRPGEIFNIGSGQQWSNQQVVAMIESLAGHSLPRDERPYPAHSTDTPFWVANNDKARQGLGWEPKHGIENGLAKTWEWIARHRDLYETMARTSSRRA